MLWLLVTLGRLHQCNFDSCKNLIAWYVLINVNNSNEDNDSLLHKPQASLQVPGGIVKIEKTCYNFLVRYLQQCDSVSTIVTTLVQIMNSKTGILGLVGHNKYMLSESFSLKSYGESSNKLLQYTF